LQNSYLIMRGLSSTLTLVFALFAFVAIAQPSSDLAGAEANKCYARCLIQDQYETVTEQVLVKAASQRVEVVPAVYETVTEQVLSKEAGNQLSAVAAQFETVSEQVLSKEAGNTLTVIPAQFETVTEQVLAKTFAEGIRAVCNDNGSGAGTTDNNGGLTAGGRSSVSLSTTRDADGDVVTTASCNPRSVSEQVLSKEAYTTITTSPARFEDVTEQVLVKEAFTTLRVVPATFETVTDQVLEQEAYTTLSVVPATFETVTEQVLAAQATSKLVIKPAKYETTTEQVLSKEAYSTITVTPAVYETVTEQVLVKEAATTLSVVPAVYETVTEQVLTKEASTKIERVPAKYETVTEQIEVSPASTKWVKKKADKNCLSANPDDCLVWCLVEVAPQYRTITKTQRVGCDSGYTDTGGDCTKTIDIPAVYSTRSYQKLVSPASTQVTEIPARYETRSYQKLVSPASANTTTVPAVYTTRSITKVASPATTETIDVPARYETRSYQKLASPASVNTVQVPAKYGTRTYQKLVTDATTESVTVPAQYTTRSYRKLAAPASSNTTDVPAVYTQRTYTVAGTPSAQSVPCGNSSTLSGVNFASGSAELIGNSRSVISNAAAKIKADANCTARIVGHTDSQGGDAANQSLSQRRARTVYNVLVEMGIPASRLSYEGMGETNPIADNSTAAGRAANRRIELVSSCGGSGNCDQYTTRSYQKLVSDATTQSTEIPAQYTTRSYQKLASSASSNTNEIAAQYETRSYQKLVSPASTRSIDIPAEYRTITKTNLVKKGGFTEWRPVVCDTDVTADLVRRVQNALISRGYNPGVADNQFGSATKKALVKFQKDNNLPVGNLDFETLKALGVNQ
jgi:outer membrane protein OmpA-like peptidoglycan-associated protein/flagellar biosynthesis/type III secretory pathway protein FliH